MTLAPTHMRELLPVVFVIALLSSFCLTWLVRALARRAHLESVPHLERHLHARPIPRIGGVGIYLAFCASLGLSYIVLKAMGKHDFGIGITHEWLRWIVFTSGIVFLLGLYDDVRELRPRTKIAVEVVAAILLFASGIRIESFQALLPGHIFGNVLSFIITVAFVVFVTNSFNLIDGMDGLAAGSALFSTVALTMVAWLNHRNSVVLISVALAGTLIGFLRFNFNPATIFLGDSGSLFIGFVLSAAAISGTQKVPAFIAIIAPVVALALPITETVVSILRRSLRSKPIFTADSDHIHHRLLLRGMTQRDAVLTLYAVSGAGALLSLLLLYRDAFVSAGILVIFCLIIFYVVDHLDYEDVREMREAVRRIAGHRQKVSANIELRKVMSSAAKAASVEEAISELNSAMAVHQAELRFFRDQLAAAEYLAGSRDHWCLAVPLRSGTHMVLLCSSAPQVSFDLGLVEQCGMALARAAEREEQSHPALIRSASTG